MSCDACKFIEYGDTLYYINYMIEYDDGAITYHPIWDVKYCPICGNKLKKFAWDEDKCHWDWMEVDNE